MLLTHLEKLDLSNNNIATITKEIAAKIDTLKEIHLEQNPYLNQEQTESLIEKHVLMQANNENTQKDGTKTVASPFKNLANALNYAKAVETSKAKQSSCNDNNNLASVQTETNEEENPNQKLITQIREEWEKEEAKSNSGKNLNGADRSKLCLTIVEHSNTLHLYGVAALDSLTQTEYHTTITEVKILHYF